MTHVLTLFLEKQVLKREFLGNFFLRILSRIFISKSFTQRLIVSEAATGGVLEAKVFLEISQNSQESICARASFSIKLEVTGLQLY